jgi:hypothetical protein
MIKHHPYQNVYFNLFAGKNVSHRFDMDYWGLSYREALEYLLKYDLSPDVPVTISSSTKDGFFKTLKKKDRERIRNVPVGEAKYFVSNFRSPHNYFSWRKGEYPFVNEIFSVSVKNNKIVGVYKLR